MRLLSLTTYFAIVLGLLAGCSNSTQGPSSLLPSASGTGSLGDAHGAPRGKEAYLKFLKAQIDGKVPHFLSRAVLVDEYNESLKNDSPPRVQRSSKPVAIWVTKSADEYLLGLTQKGKTARAIYLQSSSEYCFPGSVKVDHSQNVWVSCGFGEGAFAGKYEERNSSGALTNAYPWQAPTLQCSPSAISCQNVAAYSSDGAENASNVVLAINIVTQSCTYYESQQNCNDITAGGFLWWPLGNPSAAPTFISLQNCCGSSPIYAVGSMDLDSNGNILFEYSEMYYLGGGCNGVGEIENPTSASWSFVSVIPCSSYTSGGPMSSPAGLYVSHSGSTSTLNITDTSGLIYRWALPFNPSSPYTTLGPTPKNVEGKGGPTSGGFGLNDTHVVQADLGGWVDFGTVATNKWKTLTSRDLSGAIAGAALTPSDK